MNSVADPGEGLATSHNVMNFLFDGCGDAQLFKLDRIEKTNYRFQIKL